jgi:hypothetical protein
LPFTKEGRGNDFNSIHDPNPELEDVDKEPEDNRFDDDCDQR